MEGMGLDDYQSMNGMVPAVQESDHQEPSKKKRKAKDDAPVSQWQGAVRMPADSLSLSSPPYCKDPRLPFSIHTMTTKVELKGSATYTLALPFNATSVSAFIVPADNNPPSTKEELPVGGSQQIMACSSCCGYRRGKNIKSSKWCSALPIYNLWESFTH